MSNMRLRRSIIEVGILGCHLVRGMENRLLLPWTITGTKGTQVRSMARANDSSFTFPVAN